MLLSISTDNYLTLLFSLYERDIGRKQASVWFQKCGADGGDALESQPKVQWEFGDRKSFLPHEESANP